MVGIRDSQKPQEILVNRVSLFDASHLTIQFGQIVASLNPEGYTAILDQLSPMTVCRILENLSGSVKIPTQPSGIRRDTSPLRRRRSASTSQAARPPRR